MITGSGRLAVVSTVAHPETVITARTRQDAAKQDRYHAVGPRAPGELIVAWGPEVAGDTVVGPTTTITGRGRKP